MDRDFWLERWQRNEIGFHQPGVNAALARYWATLGLRPDSRVLVPLAGKSLDMAWLRSLGHGVVGIELSEIAVRDFFVSQGLEPVVQKLSAETTRYAAGGYEMLHGDFFAVTREAAGSIAAVYDRAALIALPPDMRRRYAAKMPELCGTGTPMLLVTLEYEQSRRAGPPFAVLEDEVRSLYGSAWSIELLDRTEPPDAPRFKANGVPWISEAAYRLARLR